jgi:L-threonylcarbamoyladenylate synthase
VKIPLQVRSLNRAAARILKEGGVGVIPTDTLYGIVASALSREAVSRVYRLRRRDPKKPSIILISALSDLWLFGVRPTPVQMAALRRIWPGKLSVIFKTKGAGRYLDRGTGTLAFRWPRSKALQRFLRDSGPLIAPSANWEGYPPAGSVSAARRYFGGQVDVYVDTGPKRGRPSTLAVFRGRRLQVLRPGAGRLPKTLEYGRLA